jgi:hypothetical protein
MKYPATGIVSPSREEAHPQADRVTGNRQLLEILPRHESRGKDGARVAASRSRRNPMKLIVALAALGALTFAILAYAPADAETVCYTNDSGAEKCWTIPDPPPPPPPPPNPCVIKPESCVEVVPTPTPVDQFCIKLPDTMEIVCIPLE